MALPKRKHVSTGNARGGARQSAGRPLGSATGQTKAIEACRWRVPEGAPEEAKQLADWALQRVVDVTAGRVHYTESRAILSGATYLRTEVCGPIAQRVEHAGSDGNQLVVEIVRAERPSPPPHTQEGAELDQD